MEVVIYGIGDLARELYSYMKSQFNILGFCVDDEYLKDVFGKIICE